MPAGTVSPAFIAPTVVVATTLSVVLLLIWKLTVDSIFPWLSFNCSWLELSCNCVPTEPIKEETGILSINSLSALYNSKDKVVALYLKSVPSLSSDTKDTCDNWFPLLSYNVNVLFVGYNIPFLNLLSGIRMKWIFLVN